MKIDKDEILRCFRSSRTFLKHVNDFIWHMLHPDAPETQLDMNIKSQEDFEKLDNELKELVEKIKALRGDDNLGYLHPELFVESIVQWEKYRTAKAKADAANYSGGSIYPTIYAHSEIWTTKEKIESLKEEFGYELKSLPARKKD